MATSIDSQGSVKSGMLSIRTKSGLIKRSKKHHATLFQKSQSGLPRLEVYDTEKDYKIGSYFLIIPGSEVVSVKESYKSQSSDEKFGFIIATKDQQHYFYASDRDEQEDWLKSTMSILLNSDVISDQRHSNGLVTQNDLYESADEFLKEYRVKAGVETRQKLGVNGEIRLLVENGNLTLITMQGNRVARWGIEHFRRFGYNDNDFHVEAGRKSEHGEGTFNFVTQQGKQIHTAVTKEKRVCRENKNAEAAGLPKSKLLPGQLTSVTNEDTEIPLSTGGHIYEDIPEFKTKATKPKPEKPVRQKNPTGGKRFGLENAEYAVPAGASGGVISLSDVPQVKSNPTHAGAKPAGVTAITYQPAREVFSNRANNPNQPQVNPSVYSEVEEFKEAWKDHGKDDDSDDPIYEMGKSEGDYDQLNYTYANHNSFKPLQASSQASEYAAIQKPQTPVQIYEQEKQPQQETTFVKPSEPIYAEINPLNKRKKQPR